MLGVYGGSRERFEDLGQRSPDLANLRLMDFNSQGSSARFRRWLGLLLQPIIFKSGKSNCQDSGTHISNGELVFLAALINPTLVPGGVSLE